MNVLYLLSFFLTFCRIHCQSDNTSCYQDTCFTVIKTKVNYSTAAEECKKLNLSLAFVENKNAQSFLQKYININNESYYIGLRYIPNERFIWDSNSRIIPNLTWATQVIIKLQSSCAYLLDNLMNLDSCEKPRSYICSNSTETDIVNFHGKCKRGSFKFLSKCYTMNLNCSDENLDWKEAQLKCKNLNSSLVVTDSMIEQEFLTGLMTVSPQAAWTGLHYYDMKDVFNIWIDVNKKMPRYSINFKKNEPNNMKNKEECLMIYHRPSDVGRINDEKCIQYLNPICESSLITNSIETYPETPNPLFHRGKCQDNYFEFNETCYKVVKIPKSYMDATKDCNGMLLKVYSFIDVAFIRSLLAFKGISNSWITVNTSDAVGGAWWLHNENKDIVNKKLNFKSCYYIDSMKRGLQLASCSEKLPFICYEFLNSQGKLTDNLVCPWNWFKIGRKCFKYQETYSSFSEAVEKCKIFNGKLATFKNMKELMALNFLSDVWIGLNGTSYLNNSWIDGSPMSYCRFRHNKDIYSEIRSDPNNFCFFKTSKGEFNFAKCSLSMYFACEKPATENNCPEHFNINIDGDCFGEFQINKTWIDAEKHCQDQGGNQSHLASFHFWDQETFLLSKLNYSNPYWIGLKIYDNTRKWIDGSPINYQQVYFISSVSLSEGLSCFSVKKVVDKKLIYWNQDNCGIKRYFICKISKNQEGFNTTKTNLIKPNYFCPKDFVKHGLNCYKLFEQTLTWPEAIRKCKSLFWPPLPVANLASFDNLQQYDSLLSSLRNFNNSWIWIGLYEHRETKQLLWSNQKSFEILKSPFNGSSNEEYTLAMEISTNPFRNGRWLMLARMKNFPFICRVDPHKALNTFKDNPNTESFIYKTNSACGSSFVEYDGNCYFFNKKPMLFNNANNRCKEMGANLLILNDTFEENFVRAFLAKQILSLNRIWIGLKVDSTNILRNWTTTNSSHVYYTHWNTLGSYENSYTYLYDDPKYKTDGCYVLRFNRGVSEDNGMARSHCTVRIQSVCKKTLISQNHGFSQNPQNCGTSINGTRYNLNVRQTVNNELCVRWDLVMLKNPYVYHLNTQLISSMPFNKDGYISYSLDRCSEFRYGSKIYGYSCYIFKDKQYILKDCLFQHCLSNDKSSTKTSSGHPFMIVMSLILIISAFCFIIYVYRKNLLSLYRVRVFMASVLGRYQPDWLRESHSRSQVGTPGGTGFVNPIYTPLESRY